MVALYLVTLGGKPLLLGGSTPPDELAEGAQMLCADVVGLTVTPLRIASGRERTSKPCRGNCRPTS